MSEADKIPSILGEAFIAALRQIVREEMQAAMQKNGNNGHGEDDRLIDVEKAAEILGMSEDWLYRHAKKLPFTRKPSPSVLKFSYLGIQQYIATKKPTARP